MASICISRGVFLLDRKRATVRSNYEYYCQHTPHRPVLVGCVFVHGLLLQRLSILALPDPGGSEQGHADAGRPEPRPACE